MLGTVAIVVKHLDAQGKCALVYQPELIRELGAKDKYGLPFAAASLIIPAP